ncbi:hypothetical protein TNCT_403431 [Trichonephila clavata]|uniref:Uncharacterized protein n=1 Tax=Trichonephila clavata TaxID=2740835 RepID=A0A8X6HC44_TRICU|nr:hypothetical protein TNCT_403431 [Trichonephila clavata]
MELVSNSACLYSIQCLQPVHGQQDTFLSRKCIHPQQNSGLKLSMIFKDFDEQHRLPYDKVLETLVRHPYFRERYREKYCLPPATVDFVFQQSSTRHVSLDYKDASNLSMDLKTFQDAMDPLRNKETVPGRSFEKSLY